MMTTDLMVGCHTIKIEPPGRKVRYVDGDYAIFQQRSQDGIVPVDSVQYLKLETVAESRTAVVPSALATDAAEFHVTSSGRQG